MTDDRYLADAAEVLRLRRDVFHAAMHAVVDWLGNETVLRVASSNDGGDVDYEARPEPTREATLIRDGIVDATEDIRALVPSWVIVEVDSVSRARAEGRKVTVVPVRFRHTFDDLIPEYTIFVRAE